MLAWTPNGPTGPIEVTDYTFTNAALDGSADSVTEPGIYALDHAAVLGDSPSELGTDGPRPWRCFGDTGAPNGFHWDDVDTNNHLVGEGGPGIAIRLEITAINVGTANLSLLANTLSQTNFMDINGTEY